MRQNPHQKQNPGFSTWVFLCVLLSVCPSFAAFDNMNSILIGDQSAGMGGAATAVGEDASGAAWYNPAGLAVMPGSSFSAAVGIYKKFATSYGAKDDLMAAALKVNQGFFRALPSSSGSVIRPKEGAFEDWTIAMSILVPEYDQFRGDVNRSSENVSSLNFIDESLWVGGAMSRRISSSESFGFTVYYTARSLSRGVTDRTYRGPTDFEIYTEDRALTQNSVVFVLGYLKELNENWKWGLSARLPNIHVLGRATYVANTLKSGQAEQPINLTELDSKSRIPMRVNLGLAFNDNDRWLVAWDLNYQAGENYEDIQTDQAGIAEQIEHLPSFNSSLGVEYRWSSWLKTRLGVFTNFSANPDPDPTKVKGQGEHIHQMGFSANAAFRSGPIEYTFGGYYSGGEGQSVQRVDQAYQKISKSQNIFTMLVGTSYYF